MKINSPTSALARAIRTRRLEAQVSQEQLAELAGCHRNYIGLLETGKRNPSYLRLKDIAKALAIPLSTLIHDAEKT